MAFFGTAGICGVAQPRTAAIHVSVSFLGPSQLVGYTALPRHHVMV